MPALAEYGYTKVGRLLLTEALSVAGETVSGADRTLSITGQESVPPQTAQELAQLQDDLMLLPGSFLPVTFTNKTDRNGYYWIGSSGADLSNWTGEVITCTWKLDLLRVGSDTEIDIESRCSGSASRNNSYSATGQRWHSPPVGHYGYWVQGAVPTVVTRTGSDGAQKVYLGVPTTTNPRWGCAVGDYPLGRVRFLDSNGLERAGPGQALAPTGWSLHNGLCRVTLAGTAGVSGASGTIGSAGVGVLSVGAWTSGAWANKAWDITWNSASLGAPTSASLLRNDFEAVVLRLVWPNLLGPGRTYLDILLRRGARVAELWLQSSIAGAVSFARTSTEAGTQTAGYLTASANDANGHRYFLGAAQSFTAAPTTGGISRGSVTGSDFAVGVVAGGSGAVAGDTAADLYKQYLGAPSERVQGVRR